MPPLAELITRALRVQDETVDFLGSITEARPQPVDFGERIGLVADCSAYLAIGAK